ncbi:MAG: MBL fold metallo-hydrolase [Bacteroidales bacterium]|nr:MBL fold metallo-hydrolase [Bacteroidales bacterium]
MSNKFIIAAMATITLISCTPKIASKHAKDTFKAEDGTEITFTYYGHASIGIEALGKHIYVDPLGENVDWDAEPEADLVLITHDHYDHLDTNVVRILTGEADGYTKLAVGETVEPFDRITVEGVPAYNISPDQLDFHPRERGDVGYIITIAGKRIYVSGDTEDNEDVLAIRDIDIAFVCCNKPYTMTVGQCVNVVKAIRPTVFIPYHYGGTDIPTDLTALQDSLKDVTEVLIRPLE